MFKALILLGLVVYGLVCYKLGIDYVREED